MRGITFFVVALQVCGSFGNKRDNSVDCDAVRGISGNFNKFAKDLYQKIAEHEKGNFVVSPISVSTVLSMLAIGSAGNTREQLTNVLHFGDHWVGQHRAIKPLLENLNSFSNVDLKLANQIFVSNRVDLNDKFEEVSQKLYKTSPQKIDYRNRRRASRSINRWCAEKTNSKIRNMVTPGDIHPDTIMMLLNAVYFKGNWSEKFDKSETRNLPFDFQNGTIKRVPTMYHRGNYAIGSLRNLGVTFLRLPYEKADENDDLSMYILLPTGAASLSDIEKNLSRLDLNVLSNTEPSEVDVLLPKFRVDSKLALNDALKELGLADMFSSNADFRYLVRPHNVAVSKIAQEAFIEVNEDGSEAAAITEAGLTERMGALRFRVDRPFISLIATKNSILFMSRIVAP